MIRLRALRLTGPVDRYEVEFDKRKSNLAVIAGQISTGKSTILEFIDYCLGAEEHPTHPEVAKRVRAVALELEIDGLPWTIERPIFSAEELAWVHRGGAEDKDAAIARKNLDGPSEPDSLSAWLIQSAGLEGLRLKVTAQNPNSPTNLMSFRDLMWVCYLPNRRLDNQALLFEDNQFKRYKLQQVIEVLFDVADQRLTDLMEQLTLLRSEHRDQVGEVKSLEGFLRENGTPLRLEIERLRVELTAKQTALQQQLEDVGARMRQATGYAEELRSRYAAARSATIQAQKQLRDRRSLVERLLPLRGQYAEDERKLTFIGEARTLINPLHVISCPSCLRALQEPPDIKDSTCTLCGQRVDEETEPDADFNIDVERKTTRERTRHLDRYINEVEHEITLGAAALEQARLLERTLEAELNSRVASELSPFISEREGLIGAREKAHAQETALEQAIRWHEGLERRQADLQSLEARQKVVRAELEERRKNRPEKAAVVEDLSARFAAMLREWGFPKVDDGGPPHLSDEFVPWVRGRPYREIGSSGALTLIALAWQLTLFERAVEEGLPHPGFLIIDSPQKNLSPDAVGDTEFLDPKIVERLWSHIDAWCESHPQAQVVIVDNTPPPTVEDHVIVRFSRDPALPPYGLITDETG